MPDTRGPAGGRPPVREERARDEARWECQAVAGTGSPDMR